MGMWHKILNILTKPKRVLENYKKMKATVYELEKKTQHLDERARQLDERAQKLDGKVQLLEDNHRNDICAIQTELRHEDDRREIVMQNRLNALQEKIGIWQDIPEVLVDDGSLPRENYLEAWGDEARKKSMDVFYFNVANVFRGSADDMRKNVELFLPYVVTAAQNNSTLPFADIGCGRGEFLDALREKGIACLGIDLNKESAKRAIEQGHKVVIGDALEYLKKQEDAAFSGMSMVMVSEHIEFSALFDAIFVFGQKIARGGALLINTINPYCYERFGNFHIDPSHINYMAPDTYKIVMEMAGFTGIKVIWSAAIRESTTKDIHAQYENVTLVGYREK